MIKEDVDKAIKRTAQWIENEFNKDKDPDEKTAEIIHSLADLIRARECIKFK